MTRSGMTSSRALRVKAAIFVAASLSMALPATVGAQEDAPEIEVDELEALILDSATFDAATFDTGADSETLEDRELADGESVDLDDESQLRNLTIDELLGVTDTTAPGTVVGANNVLLAPEAPNIPQRRVEGEIMLYAFDEGSGTVVRDQSGHGNPLNLEVRNPARAAWVPGGLELSGTALTTGANAAKLIQEAEESDQVTLEAWVTPSSASPSGPQQLMMVGTTLANHDAGVFGGFDGSAPNNRWEGTVHTRVGGAPEQRQRLLTSEGALDSDLTHVVLRRGSDGNVSLFINGVRVSYRMTEGRFDWANQSFNVGADFNGSRPFNGVLHLVAAYGRGLSDAEITQNYVAGPGSGVSPSGPDDDRPVFAGPALIPGATNISAAAGANEPVRMSLRIRGPLLNRVIQSDAGLAVQHVFEIADLRPETTYRLSFRAVDQAGNRRITNVRIRTNTTDAANTNFNIWYGRNNQRFGHRGDPQRWVNILGSVSDPDGVAALSYRLNGEAPQLLGLGADQRRLVNTNDFNIDMLRTHLRSGTNVLELLAVDDLGNIEAFRMTFRRQSGSAPLNETISWSQVTNIQNAVYVLDGHWEVDRNSSTVQVGLADAGYDRMALLGELGWTDYEVRTSVVPGALNDDPSRFSSDPGFGFIVHWNGHNDSLVRGSQPLVGFRPDSSGDPTPFGSIMWVRDGRLRVMGESAKYVATGAPFSYVVGETYQVYLSVSTIGSSTTYCMKVWQGTEPTDCGVEWTSPGAAIEPTSGSLSLLAHEMALSFGDITISQL